MLQGSRRRRDHGVGRVLSDEHGIGAGYPIASVPLGFSSYNGRPHGMEIMARNGEEEKMFEVMSAWETLFPEARKPPPSLEKSVEVGVRGYPDG